MHTVDRPTFLENLVQLRRDLHAGTYMEWAEPLSRGRKGQDHSSQRIINVRVGGDPRDPATLPARVSVERRQISINIEALKRFASSTYDAIEWQEEAAEGVRKVSITIRHPQTYDSIGWELMKETMSRRGAR